ncbi:hypothetical protein MHC_05065 [Mycoplasma haemocanis str. Illinois]|uniref:Uncharacterized protein n=1 Tax=Mycoplasma haemocanis (strain Illinois) TaxID=1111676 RepID=H6N897_MYCHN|nr:hypothetical protein [Mycoplasma haemocanis]AEW45869.1 hypothetical protein MHC_05065 [Mycoplasma haemocanis str. Illinois]
MSLRSKSLLVLVGLTSGVGVERFLSSQGELRPEPVITKEEQEGKPASKAKLYAIYHSTILQDPENGNKPYPEVKGISRTPLTEDFINEDEELKKCVWRGNLENRAYAAWDSRRKVWECSDAMQYKDWFNGAMEDLPINEGKILGEMKKVKNLTDSLRGEKEKLGKDGGWQEMLEKCKKSYVENFSESSAENDTAWFCNILLWKIDQGK